MFDLDDFILDNLHKWSGRTDECYSSRIKHFIDWCGSNDVSSPDDVDTRTLKRYFGDLRKYSYGTRRVTFTVLGLYFRWLHETGRVSVDRFAEGKQNKQLSLPRKQRSVVKVVDMQTVKAMIGKAELAASAGDVYAIRDVAIMRLLINTGIRNSELNGLLLDSVSVDRLEIVVKGKGGHERIVPFSPATGLSIRRWLNNRPKVGGSKYLFLTMKANRYGIYNRMSRMAVNVVLRKWHKAINGDITETITSHSWRRTFASEFIRNGGNVFLLKEILGHSDIKITELYVKVTLDDLHQSNRFAPDF